MGFLPFLLGEAHRCLYCSQHNIGGSFENSLICTNVVRWILPALGEGLAGKGWPISFGKSPRHSGSGWFLLGNQAFLGSAEAVESVIERVNLQANCSELLVIDTIDQQGALLINGIEGWIGRPAYTIYLRIYYIN
jgi:hypothetical protein